MAYRDIYGDDDSSEDPIQLQLLTSPLAATEEVVALYQAGLAPIEIAMPAVLHSIGASKDQIESAVEEGKKEVEKKCQCEDEERAFQKEEHNLNLQERRQALAGSGPKQQVDLDAAKVSVDQAKANVEKTKEETTQLSKKPSTDASKR